MGNEHYARLADELRDHQNGGRRHECESAADAIDCLQSQLAAANERADGLQRTINEARKQEPVEFRAKGKVGHFLCAADYAGAEPLYAAPVPAQPAVVPKHAADRIHEMRDVLFDIATSDVMGDRPEHSFVTVAINRDTLSRAAILSTTDTEVSAAPEIFPGTTNALAKLSIKPKE